MAHNITSQTETLCNSLQALDEIARIFVGMAFGPQHRKEGDHPCRMISVRCLTEGCIEPHLTEKTWMPVSAEQYTVKTGDVLVSSRSTNLKVAIVPADLDGCLINATLIAIRCSSLIQPKLLAAFFRHPHGMAKIEAVCISGTRQMNVTVSALKNIHVPVPPPAEQQRFVALLEAAEEAYNNALCAANTRKSVAEHIVIDRMIGKPQPSRSS